MLPQRLYVGDHVVDFRSGQREVRHRTVWARKESTHLIGVHSNRRERGRSLLHGGRVTCGHYVAMGTPLARQLGSLCRVGRNRRNSRGAAAYKNQKDYVKARLCYEQSIQALTAANDQSVDFVRQLLAQLDQQG